jgi:hypothetical protein
MTIFKSLPAARVTHLETFMRSKSDIMKDIKTKFAYANGGLFRPEEITYLDSRYHDAKEVLDRFLTDLSTPTAELAAHFNDRYSAVKSAIRRCDDEIRLCASSRARIAFPNSKRKADILFSKRPLAEKLALMTDTSRGQFTPETLPGLTRTGNSTQVIGSNLFKAECYASIGDNELQMSVVDTWFTGPGAPEEA